MNEHELYRLIADHPTIQCCINSQVIAIKPNGEIISVLTSISRDNALATISKFAKDFPDSHYCVTVVRDSCGAATRIIFGAPYVNMKIIE